MTDDNPRDELEPDDESADKPVDPDAPSEPDSNSDSGKVLTPEELDIGDSEYAEQLDDSGRYVVSPGSEPPNVTQSESESLAPDRQFGDDRRQSRDDSRSRGGVGQEPNPRGRTAPVSPEAARTLLADELGRANSRYGIDIVARFDGDTVRHRTVSSDVVATFENLVQWYARHVTNDTPADEVIEILLRESEFETPETTPNLAQLLESHNLEKTDSIEALVEAINDEAGR